MSFSIVPSFIFLILLVNSVESAADSDWQPISTLEIIKMRGFIGQMYTIESRGYPLTLYRITNPLADQTTLNKYPVLYGHGILYDAMNMISRSENSRPRKPIIGEPTINFGNQIDGSDDYSLPFMFSNNNFDVWLYDARGTDSNNVNISVKVVPTKAHKFWDFSLDDESLSDLPLLIDFVLTKTASTKLVYVGYSESTLFMFALLATAPEYADKIVALVCQAPVAYVTHIKGVTLPLFLPFAALMPEIFQYSFLPQPFVDTVDASVRKLCKSHLMSKLLCTPIFHSIAGNGASEMAPVFFTKFFHLTSLKAIKQFIQIFLGRRFGMYDYGPLENKKKYGQAKPPAYDLGKIKLDCIILVRGSEDFLSTPEDQATLIRELGVKPYMDIVVPQYNHFDFIDGKDLINNVNRPVMIGVYNLMYRDGPNIMRNAEQISVI